MTITLELPEEIAKRWNALPEAEKSRFALAALKHEFEETTPLPRYSRPAPPRWLDEIQPRNPASDGTNGLHRIVGILETPEQDRELTQLLQEES